MKECHFWDGRKMIKYTQQFRLKLSLLATNDVKLEIERERVCVDLIKELNMKLEEEEEEDSFY
jgi:hypothetical protein